MRTFEIKLSLTLHEWFSVTAETLSDATEAAMGQATSQYAPFLDHCAVIDSEEIISEAIATDWQDQAKQYCP